MNLQVKRSLQLIYTLYKYYFTFYPAYSKIFATRTQLSLNGNNRFRRIEIEPTTVAFPVSTETKTIALNHLIFSFILILNMQFAILAVTQMYHLNILSTEL